MSPTSYLLKSMEWARIDKDKETKLIVGYVARYEQGVDKPNVVNLVFNDVELCKYIKVIAPPFRNDASVATRWNCLNSSVCMYIKQSNVGL